MKVALTGGTGVVGSALLRRLTSDGFEVAALVRSDRGAMAVRQLGAEPVVGDLVDRHSLLALVEGATWVFNVAGVNQLCVSDPSPMWNANVEGARAILEASESSGVKRLIHTSSVVTLGAGGDDAADETTKHRGWFLSEYERTKTVGERLALASTGGVEVVAVNPSSVQGPGRSTGSGRLLLAVARGSARVAVDATVSLLDIDDCAAGHIAAARLGKPGERYILSGSTTTVRELTRSIALIAGHNRRPWILNPEPASKLGPLTDCLGALLPGLGLCNESLRVLVEGHSYDGTRASRDLGLEYTPLAETLRRTVAWFRSEGLL